MAAHNADDVRDPGKVHRYRVTDWWGKVPDQIKALVGAEDGYCVDYWRGMTTEWTLANRVGRLTGGWTGEYVGVSPAALHIDGGGS